MSDIVDRLQNEARTMLGDRDLCTDAIKEIKNLRRLCRELHRVQQENEDMYGQAADKIEQLLKALQEIIALEHDHVSMVDVARIALKGKP